VELLKLYYRRVRFWLRFVGRDWYGRIGPVLAWELACIIHPLEDLNKWWLGTGWLGPGTDFYIERMNF
jgi:hypothetical protein